MEVVKFERAYNEDKFNEFVERLVDIIIPVFAEELGPMMGKLCMEIYGEDFDPYVDLPDMETYLQALLIEVVKRFPDANDGLLN